MAAWRVPSMWQDSECWIIGGGPSLTDVFQIPDQVVKKVRNGDSPALYSDYMKQIHDKHIIGINMAYRIGAWMDMIYFGDKSFFDKVKYDLIDYPGLIVTSSDKRAINDKTIPGVKQLQRMPKKWTLGIAEKNNAVCWNHNSGAAAISIAAHTGVKRIILIGFDMTMDSDANRHWHFLYGEKVKPPPYPTHLLGFPVIAKQAKERGIEILNCSTNTAIKSFKIVKLEDVL